MTKSHAASDRADVYTRITAEIIAAVETGAGEWRMPWHHDGTATSRPTNVATAKRYRGITDAQVRKGERATTVVLWKEVTSANDGDDGSDDDGRRRMFARAFSVFNLAQVDGYKPESVPVLPDSERLTYAETFIANLGITTVFGSSEACYRPSSDTVHLPNFAQFRDAASAYGVHLHECGHASGAKHRLDRDLSGRFGSAAYAAEECIVEILSGLILADLGIAHHPRPDHAAYIASWIELLKGDPRAISKPPARPSRPPIGCTLSSRSMQLKPLRRQRNVVSS